MFKTENKANTFNNTAKSVVNPDNAEESVKVAGPVGFEPTTIGLEGRCAIHPTPRALIEFLYFLEDGR